MALQNTEQDPTDYDPIDMNYFQRGPIKLLDCSLQGSAESNGQPNELIIVEGDSALASVASVRNNHSQAVLAMQGKPLNALKASAAKVSANELYQRLQQALGIEMVDELKQQQLDVHERLKSLRYQHVLFLFDPDADGVHCAALMMMFFYRWMRPLLESGRVSMIRFSPDEMKAWRPRGLGSIDPDILRSLCVDPQTRRQQVLSVRDAQIAIEVFQAQ